jgi:hypothetical protein
MVAYVYAAQFHRSIATGGSPAGEKAREQQAAQQRPDQPRGAHLLNNQKLNRYNCPDALPNSPLTQAEKVREEQKKREDKPPPQ